MAEQRAKLHGQAALPQGGHLRSGSRQRLRRLLLDRQSCDALGKLMSAHRLCSLR